MTNVANWHDVCQITRKDNNDHQHIDNESKN